MASHIEQTTTSENTVTTFMQVKSVNRSENEMRKKFALGDIKNAPLTTNLFSGKKTMMKKEEAAIEEPIEMIIASRKPVNSFDIWVEEATFSDEIVNQFIRRDIEAQNMNPYDETEPKNLIIEDDILEPIERLTPEPLLAFDDILAFDGILPQPPLTTENIYNDPESSELNHSLFDLSAISDGLYDD